MAVPQSKKSKMRVRQRQAQIRYEGLEPAVCANCGAPCLPHRVCKKCGYYGKQQVMQVKEAKSAKA